MKRFPLILLTILAISSTGCERLKGPKGDSGAPGTNGAQGPEGPQGPGGPSGEPGEFFEFTGVVNSTAPIPVGNLTTESLVIPYFDFPSGAPYDWQLTNATVDYTAGTVSYQTFGVEWGYKIIVIHPQ